MARLLRFPQHSELSLDDSRLLIESVQDYAIFMLDPDGRVVTWNPGAEAIKGYAAEEVIGQHFSTFYTPQDLADGKPAEELELVSKAGRIEVEGWRLRKDGSQFWANVVITALRDENGNLRGFAKVTRDLTARRATEEALRSSEERFRLLIEAVSDYAIYMIDGAGHVTTWNSGAQKIKGYDASEIIGKNFALFFPEEDVRSGKPERELDHARTLGHFEEEAFRVRKDGSRFWANITLTPIRDSKGDLLGFAKVTRDLTARLEAEQNARALAREQAARAASEEAEGRLRDSEARYRALSHRHEIILEGLADGMTVQDRTGRVIYANTEAARTCGFSSVEELLAATSAEIVRRFELLDESGLPIDPNAFPGRRVLRGEPPCSLVMRVRELATGQDWWRLVRASPVPGSDGLPDLAISVWHDISESRRREQHERYLAQATAALSVSLDYGSMLSTLAGLLVPGLATWCSIHLHEGAELRPVVVAHEDPEKVTYAREVGRKYPPDPSQPRGVWNVLRTGAPELYTEIPDELVVQAAQDAEHLAILRAVGMKSVIIVPIRAQERVLGTVSLISADGGRRYDAHDLALAEELGRRAGNSIENARLYAAERKARDQLALVAQAGESFSTASGCDEIHRRVVAIALPTLGDFAFFDVVDGKEVQRTAAAYEDSEADALINATTWLLPTRDSALALQWRRESDFHPLVDEAWVRANAGSAEHEKLLRRLQLGSVLAVPLYARGEVLGSLTVCYGKSGRHHTTEDLRLAEELARRAAIAIVQVRLYVRAQEAAAKAEEAAERAEEANRVKDEFLATVSHELRTPLNAILGWSSILSKRPLETATARAVDVIHRNALAQARIIEDILDVSRIITGKLRLDLRAADLVSIVREAMDVIRPSAMAKRLSVEFTPPVASCVLVADSERLQQVVWNLLANAVKFSTDGGRINVAIGHARSKLVLEVTDTGKGIEADLLPFVFDRFKQADSSSTRRFGGLGLGLAIVRHLVELHGGKVEAASAGSGAGATFTVTLPVRAVAPSVVLPDGESENDAHEGVAHDEAKPRGALAGCRVLLVDDEPDARELLRTVLAEAGALVETASSAAEGYYAIHRFRPDVLVSDIGMPDEDGYSFIQRVNALERTRGGGIPSLALTAYTRGQDKARALALGFTTHVGKPVNPETLVAAVANLAALAPKSR